jgi:integrase
VYERTPGGVLYISAWDPTLRNERGGYRRQSLGHRDKAHAKAFAREASERLETQEQGLDAGPLMLDDLFRLFRLEQLPEMQGKHRKETERQLKLWKEVLSGSFDVQGFSRRDWDHFLRLRSQGAIDAYGREVRDPEKRRPVSKRVCAKDLAFLRSVCKWATEWRDPRTKRFLLEFNPTRGLPLPREENPRRPVVTHDRYLRLLEKADQVRVKTGHGEQAKRVRSPLRELLVIAEGTGRRIGAIVQLRWSDWLPERGACGAMRWRADSDKLSREWITPVSAEVREAIEVWRRESPGVGEAPVFPSPKDPGECLSASLASKWLRQAEELAGLEHLNRGLWHTFRRKWAIERKGLELRDVAFAGGWKDPTTLLKIYQQPDPETLEKVVMHSHKLRRA